MGRATQGVRLINLLKKNDTIASVCKVMSSELEATVEEESQQKRQQIDKKFAESTEGVIGSHADADALPDADDHSSNDDNEIIDFEK